MAIQSFGNEATADVYHGRNTKASRSIPHMIHKVARRKLDIVNAAGKLSDLKAPPNNKLEALKDDLAGYHAIRINDQWRVIFKWKAAGPASVSIVDYH